MNYQVTITPDHMFSQWREAARLALSHDIAPEQICWTADPGLFQATSLPLTLGSTQISVPKAFLQLAESVIWHNNPDRFLLLYKALWRLHKQDGNPIAQTDKLGRHLNLMAKNIGREIHKMHAFVRFRELPLNGPRRRFAAWFEPEHFIIEPGSHFFAKRFGDMDWVIASPYLTARFENGTLTYHPGSEKPSIPKDATEDLWATYFSNIFNPARIKLNAMQSEMPRKYWKNMPETKLIPDMLAEAEARVQRMHEAGASSPRPGAKIISTRYRAARMLPPKDPTSLEELANAIQHCRRCHLCEIATQAVPGRGNPAAEVIAIAPMPDDQDDLTGQAFSDPSKENKIARLLLRQGFNPKDVWLTFAVKHFKFEAQAQKRTPLPATPQEQAHCRYWLQKEIALIKPKKVIKL